jgi:hypothetical protein
VFVQQHTIKKRSLLCISLLAPLTTCTNTYQVTYHFSDKIRKNINSNSVCLWPLKLCGGRYKNNDHHSLGATVTNPYYHFHTADCSSGQWLEVWWRTWLCDCLQVTSYNVQNWMCSIHRGHNIVSVFVIETTCSDRDTHSANQNTNRPYKNLTVLQNLEINNWLHTILPSPPRQWSRYW